MYHYSGRMIILINKITIFISIDIFGVGIIVLPHMNFDSVKMVNVLNSSVTK